jgi:hypothetical protein
MTHDFAECEDNNVDMLDEPLTWGDTAYDFTRAEDLIDGMSCSPTVGGESRPDLRWKCPFRTCPFFFSNRTCKCRVRDMSGHVRECPRVMSQRHQCFCSEIGHVNVLESCVQRTFLETMFNAMIFFIFMY